MAARTRILVAVAAAAALGGAALTGMQPRRGGEAPPAQTAAGTPALNGQRAGGGDFSLRQLAGEPAVLVFYRGAHCPLCVRRLESLAAHGPAYERAGARVVAVTADPPDVARTTAREVGGDVAIVSVDEATLREWGVWPQGSPAPMPAAYVLDENGAVLFRHHGRSAAEDASDVTLLGVLGARLAERRLAER